MGRDPIATAERIALGGGVEVGAEWRRPKAARALLVLAHGAGAGMHHATMRAITDALARRGVATLRFNFPFMEAGRRRVDARPVATAAVAAAVDHARAREPELPLALGGHSFGGRMASHAVRDHDLAAAAKLVLCAFPLHPAKRPGTARAEHLDGIALPMLFLSGTRDALADSALLEGVVARLPRARLHWLADADHGYKARKRVRGDRPDVLEEMADAIAGFV